VQGAHFQDGCVHSQQETKVAEETAKAGSAGEATVIKKYANRRLYNTATSTYVTLDDLALMVRAGTNFIVYDAKTGEDITRSVLTQIIFEEENKGGAQTLLPINFLRQLIRFYGDSMQGLVPGYLNMSMDSLIKEQEKLRQQMMGPFGGDAMKSLEEQTKRNMAVFQDAMKVFNPFAAAMGMGTTASAPETDKPKTAAPSSKDDIQALKEQMAAMQRKLDSLPN
jgi:polyhydroxyalkanoate synthesis repressor PhaR